MNKSTLINTLKSFTPKEIREFGEFVNSPFFNKNQAAIKLYEYIKKYYPEFDSNKLEKETIYKNLFGKSEYNESFMKTIIHILSGLSEKFLFYVSIQGDPGLEMLMTGEELFKRKLEKPLIKLITDAGKEINKLKNVNELMYNYYMCHYYELSDKYFSWSSFKNKNLKYHKPSGNNDKLDYLTKFYFEYTLTVYRSVYSIREQSSLEFDESIPENVVQYLLKNPVLLETSPVLRLHLYEVLLQKERSDKYFFLLKDMLINESGSIDTDKKYSTDVILQQYCLRRIAEGESSFKSERLKLYKLSLENNYYRNKGYNFIHPLLYVNIVVTAIRENDLEWIESFIDKYSRELNPENAELEFYARARLSLKKKLYEEALKQLNSITNIVHVPLKILIREMFLMTYYELSYFDQGESLHASFRKFLTPNEEHFSAERLARHKKFLQYYSKLLILKQTGNKPAAVKLSEEINSNPNVVEHDWLVEKAGELVKM